LYLQLYLRTRTLHLVRRVKHAVYYRLKVGNVGPQWQPEEKRVPEEPEYTAQKRVAAHALEHFIVLALYLVGLLK
jgi:hypothetical protein